MKKIYFIIIMFFFMLVLTSCMPVNFSNLTHSDWDGNYIYYSNKRSKTTGDEEITLFDTVQYLNVEYDITYISNHSFIDENLYFVCALRNDLNDSDCSAICKYNLKTKEINVLYFMNDNTLERVKEWQLNDNYLITGVKNYLVRISLIDYSVKIIENIEDAMIYNNQIFFTKKGKLYFCNINDLQEQQISNYDNIYRFYITKNNGVDIAIIHIVKDYQAKILIYELYSKKTYCIFTATNTSNYISVSEKHVIIGEINTKEINDYKENNPYKNKLYEYVYNGEKVVLNEIYSFPKQLHIIQAYEAKRGFLRITTYKSNDDYVKYYIYDIERKEFNTEIFNYHYRIGSEKISTKYVSGEYTYYVEPIITDFYFIKLDYLYLKRKDSNGNVIILQNYNRKGNHFKNKYNSSSFLSSIVEARKDQVFITNVKY